MHTSCHHQMIYAKFKLKIYYPPPYEREIWHYEAANTNAIKNAISEFFWERAFENRSIDEKVSIYYQIIFLMKQ